MRPHQKLISAGFIDTGFIEAVRERGKSVVNFILLSMDLCNLSIGQESILKGYLYEKKSNYLSCHKLEDGSSPEKIHRLVFFLFFF